MIQIRNTILLVFVLEYLMKKIQTANIFLGFILMMITILIIKIYQINNSLHTIYLEDVARILNLITSIQETVFRFFKI
jgi:hypothetical protein